MTKPNHTCGAIPAMIRGILCLIFLALPLAAQSLSRLRLEESADLQNWQSIAITPAMIDANGGLLLPTDGTGKFYRMQVQMIATPEDLAFIPAGSFTMGRTSGDMDSNAAPVDVTVSAFYIGKYEVTKTLWDEVRAWAVSNGYTDLVAGGGRAFDHPVQEVSWLDVIKWCNARSEKEGLTPVYTVSGAVMKTGGSIPVANWSANGYRLPTEAEWEKAARGGVSGKRFPWGTDTISHVEANFWNGSAETYQSGTPWYHPSYAIGSMPYTSPVGAFAGNGYGLFDMAGNVLEWCWDKPGYGWDAYVSGATDPRGSNFGQDRVFRGGGWRSMAGGCRSASRESNSPLHRYYDLGFRVARSSVP